jgi:hypothetical protein
MKMLTCVIGLHVDVLANSILLLALAEENNDIDMQTVQTDSRDPETMRRGGRSGGGGGVSEKGEGERKQCLISEFYRSSREGKGINV